MNEKPQDPKTCKHNYCVTSMHFRWCGLFQERRDMKNRTPNPHDGEETMSCPLGRCDDLHLTSSGNTMLGVHENYGHSTYKCAYCGALTKIAWREAKLEDGTIDCEPVSAERVEEP